MNTEWTVILAVVIVFTAAFACFNCVRAFVDFRRMLKRHKQINAEMDFLQARYDEVFAEAREKIARHDWKGYGKCRQKLRQLDARWKREVTDKLKL